LALSILGGLGLDLTSPWDLWSDLDHVTAGLIPVTARATVLCLRLQVYGRCAKF